MDAVDRLSRWWQPVKADNRQNEHEHSISALVGCRGLSVGRRRGEPEKACNRRKRARMLDFGGCRGLSVGRRRGEPEKAHNPRKRARMLDFSGCRGLSMGCCRRGSQRKPATAENEHECSISAVVGDCRWVVVVVAARESPQPPKTSTNARFRWL